MGIGLATNLLAFSTYLYPLSTCQFDSIKDNKTTANLTDSIEMQTSQCFKGENPSGSLYLFSQSEKYYLLCGYDPEGEGPPSTYTSGGKDLQLTISEYNAIPITAIEEFYGSIPSIDIQVIDLVGTIDFSQSTNLTYIGLVNNDAFGGQTKITSMIFPASLKKICGHAFSGCSSLTSLTFENPDPSWMTYNESERLGIDPTFVSADEEFELGTAPLSTIWVPDPSAYEQWVVDHSSDPNASWAKNIIWEQIPKDNHLGLILGLSLGIGIPVVVGTTISIVFGIKKHKKKTKTTTPNKKK